MSPSLSSCAETGSKNADRPKKAVNNNKRTTAPRNKNTTNLDFRGALSNIFARRNFQLTRKRCYVVNANRKGGKTDLGKALVSRAVLRRTTTGYRRMPRVDSAA